MRSPRRSLRLLLSLLVMAGVGSGLVFAKAVVHAAETDTMRSRFDDAPTDPQNLGQPLPSNPSPNAPASDESGYCCLRNSAWIKGGVCDPDTRQSFLDGTDPPGPKITESDCRDGVGLDEPGILWNN